MKWRSLPIALIAAVLILAPPAHAKRRTEVHPYLEIDQTVLVDLKNSGPLLTYTSLAAGIDASTSGPRAEAQISARYEYRLDWGRNTRDSHVISGLARGRFDAVPNLLSIEGGALGTRARSDSRGIAPLVGLGNPANIAQLYSVYAGPTVATHVGGVDIGAFYRFGYSKVDTHIRGSLPAGSPEIGSFDDDTNHSAGVSVGMKSGVWLPFGWTVSGGYTRDDASQLDQRFEGKYARADVVVPVTPTVALTGGAGYEDIKASQRDARRDAGGNPVVDANGRFVTDPSSPRLLSYDTSGFIWDVGVLWRPSPRTSLEAKIGHRYGGMTYIGDFSWRIDPDNAVQVGAYDGITTFGQQIGSALSRIPTQFVAARDPFGAQFSGCVFGATGGSAGACLSPALQSISNGVYRSRGIGAIWRHTRGRISTGVALGYAERHFFAPPTAGFAINGTTDQSFYAQGNFAYRIDERSGIDATAYADWYDSGLPGASRVLGVGSTASYFRNFGPKLTGSASLGLYSTSVENFASSLVGAAQLGARYTF